MSGMLNVVRCPTVMDRDRTRRSPREESVNQEREEEWNDGADDLRTWVFSGPNMRFTARIADEEFLDQVRKGDIGFTGGDRLHMRVRQRIRTKGESTRNSFTVVRVVQHRPMAPPKDRSSPAVKRPTPGSAFTPSAPWRGGPR